jgi:hypothetical protein
MPFASRVATRTMLRGRGHTRWYLGASASVLSTPGDHPVCEHTTVPIVHAVHTSSSRQRSPSIGPAKRRPHDFLSSSEAEDSAAQSLDIIPTSRGCTVER